MPSVAKRRANLSSFLRKTTLPERYFRAFFPIFRLFLQNEPNSIFSLTISCQDAYAFFSWVRLAETLFSIKNRAHHHLDHFLSPSHYTFLSYPDSLTILEIPYVYFGRFGRFGSFSFLCGSSFYCETLGSRRRQFREFSEGPGPAKPSWTRRRNSFPAAILSEIVGRKSDARPEDRSSHAAQRPATAWRTISAHS